MSIDTTTAEQRATSLVISTERLRPNAYNPNAMTPDEFAELVAEVRHLGRLPKPVVVRPDGDGYVIVDGEHGWRAAEEVGLAEVACEVVEADDFEAMRQTYKRNQHGSHDPILLGRMFRRMLEARELSQRALAAEISVSEGSIRNALAYVEAVELRSANPRVRSQVERLGLSVEGEIRRLTVRQVRAYVALPAILRDAWLDAGADLGELARAQQVPVPIGDTGTQTTVVVDEDLAEALVGLGLDATIDPTREGFARSVRRAVELWNWHGHYRQDLPDARAYLPPVAELGLPVSILDRLPCRNEGGMLRVLVSPEEWATMLRDCAGRAEGAKEFSDMLAAGLRQAVGRAGVDAQDVTDPRVAERMAVIRVAPDFIRDADLALEDKYALARATAGVPDDLLLDAKRRACQMLQERTLVLTGRHPALASESPEKRRELVAGARALTARAALALALEGLAREREEAALADVLEDRGRLVRALAEQFGQADALAGAQVGDRPASETLERRLREMPWPDLVLLGAVALDAPDPIDAWLRAARGPS